MRLLPRLAVLAAAPLIALSSPPAQAQQDCAAASLDWGYIRDAPTCDLLEAYMASYGDSRCFVVERIVRPEMQRMCAAAQRQALAQRVQREYGCRTDEGVLGITFADRCWPLDTTEIGKRDAPSDISFSTSAEITDLRPLSGLTGLRELRLWNTQVSDLRPLSGLTGLQELRLGWTPVSDVGPLSGLTELQVLSLYNTQVSDVRPLSGLTGLQELVLTGVSDLRPLVGLTGLERLALSGSQLSDLGPLFGLTGLRELYLSGSQVRDLRPLSELTGLQRLRLPATRVRDLSPLSGLTRLHLLWTPDRRGHGDWDNDTPANRAAVAEAIRTWRPEP